MLTLLRGADVYAPEPLGPADVLAGGGRVLAVGAGLADPPPGWPCRIIDCKGKILAPGLVDAHAHLAGGGGEGGAHTRVPPQRVADFALAGVTTAIGLLGTDGTTRSIAELLATARGLEHYGLTALCFTGSYQLPLVTLTGSARSDIVHVDRIVGVGELAISDHRSSQPTYDELLRVASDVHVSGMMTLKAGILHLHLGDGPRGLALVRRALAETELPARTFHPTHCNRNRRLWAESLEYGAAGGYVDLTAFPPDDEGTVAAEEAVAAWLAAGLPVERLTLSSDGGGCLPVFDPTGVLLAMEVGRCTELMRAVRAAVGLGVPLEKALATCTSSVADLYRLSRKGRIAVGRDADLVLLGPGLGVEMVLAKGEVLVEGGKMAVRDLFASP